jgi:hypothetical protein
MTVTRGMGIHDPGVEMLLVRLVQAAYSLLVVYFVYRLLERPLGRESAMLGGLLAAAFFAMPVTAVHQLEESVCQVPLLAACWWWQRSESAIGYRLSAIWSALAGVALGTALILRFPLIGFVVAFVIMVLLRRPPITWQNKLAFLGGVALIVILQGYSNAVINHQWGYSFIQRLGPMLHPQRMAIEADGYPSSPPWHYALTLLGAFIPPVSILLLAAAVKGGRQFPLLGIATLVFLVSHSLIANKQERFLLPIVPGLFILIVAGLPWLAARIARPAMYRGVWWYFWIVNAVLLVVVTFSFAKKDRVAPLLYVYRRHDATGVVIAQYDQSFHVPEYYLGKPMPRLVLLGRRDETNSVAGPFNYVILYSDNPEADRPLLAAVLKKDLRLLTLITPSLADRLAHAINPRHNKARTALVYTTS